MTHKVATVDSSEYDKLMHYYDKMTKQRPENDRGYSPVVTVLTEHEAHAVQMFGMGHGNLKRRRDFLHPSIILRVRGVTIDGVTQAHVTRLPDS